MATIYYLILGVILLLFVFPTIFADRSPIPETSGNVHKVGEPAELDALLSSTTHVIVDFYADWCPPCRAIAPIFSKLADEYAAKGQLAFAKVNVDHVKDVASRYAITAMPTFVIFKNGRPASVRAQSAKRSTSAGTDDGQLVERIRGANVELLKGAVRAMAQS